MKHVGLNVAADPLFTVAQIRLDGALVIISADDPGMASSQNEQDNRRYALAAGVPMLEPSDSQEAYEFTVRAIELSERWQVPVLLRMTTRVCHSKTIVRRGTVKIPAPGPAHFERDFPSRVMIPAYARPAHLRQRRILAELAAWNETEGPNQLINGSSSLGIIASGAAFQFAREAAPEASFLKLGMTYPLPLEKMRAFAESVDLCYVIEEGDPYLVEAARTAGIHVEAAPHFDRRHFSRAQTRSRQAACSLSRLSPSQRLHDSERAELHRRWRHRLLFSWRSAAL
jgi:indolepyruvate ferredoxin oxidoreductase alpha subunit